MNLGTTYLEYYNNLHLFDDKQTVFNVKTQCL